MLQRSFFLFGLIFAITLNLACSDEINNSNSNASIDESQAVQKAEQINSGTVTKTELTTHHGINVWEVYMITPAGSELKVKYRVDDGTMVEIKGTSPSFEYEVQPGMNLINYSEAKSVALNSKSGEIKEWKLEKDESSHRWEYRFFIMATSQDWEIIINAISGVVLRIK